MAEIEKYIGKIICGNCLDILLEMRLSGVAEQI